MATKLGKSAYPAGLGPNDFKCYGPLACKDTEFAGTRMAELGCFQQEGVDSDKMYVAQMVTDPSNNWYLYVEYGRKGASNPQFQFTQCSSEAEAQSLYEKQCAEKNTKRGSWQSIGGLNLYRPIVKKGKPEDLYLVKDNATRSVGLPNGRNIVSANHEAATPKDTTKKKAKKTFRCDPQTTKLMRDLLGGAVSYTRSTLSGGTIPTKSSIKTARDILSSALTRVSVVGDDLDAQVNDHDLKQLTYTLYGLMPKIKPLGAPESTWILSKDNIGTWQLDMDAFETALDSGSDVEIEGDDPMVGIPVDMEWIDPKTDLGKWLLKWWPNASRKRHAIGDMRILNMWKVDRHGDDKRFNTELDSIHKEMLKGKWNNERPLHQERERFDLTPDDRKKYWEANVGLTFHGSRSVNIPGIIRQHFRIPKQLSGVMITGAMFGAFGTYLADDWRKSDGYTSRSGSYWSSGGGAVKGRHAFMFACDGIMGHPHVADGPRGFTGPPNGRHCVFGKAGHSQVQNNEWVVVPQQIIQRYLIEYTV